MQILARAAIAWLALPIAVSLGQPPDANRQSSRLAVLQVGDLVRPLWVYHQRIAIRVTEEADLEIFEAPPFGLVERELLPRSVHWYDLPAGRTTAELYRELRAAVAGPPGLPGVSEIGVVVETGEGAQYLLGSDFVVELAIGATRDDLETLAQAQGARIIGTSRIRPRDFLLSTRRDPERALAVMRVFNNHPRVKRAYPNLMYLADPTGTVAGPNPASQWHHDNPIFDDADVDSVEAWALSTGSAETIVAIIDTAPDDAHFDLPEGKISGKMSFAGCDEPPPTGECESDTFGPATPHAVAVSTLAVGSMNAQGGVGTCPSCRVLLIQKGDKVWSQILAFEHALAQGADIICFPSPLAHGEISKLTGLQELLERISLEGRDGKGTLLLFSLPNDPAEHCVETITESEDGVFTKHYFEATGLSTTMAIGGSNASDARYAASGYGDCLDVLAPAENIAFTLGSEASASDSGNSYAVPIVGGIAGLILSVAPDLCRIHVQRVLQDTADRIDDANGKYGLEDGYSHSETTTPSTHGFGRVNAFEAVRLVDSDLGRGGVDVFLRDNRLDWGNTEKPSSYRFEATRAADPDSGFIPHWHSVDIKVDSPSNGVQATPKSAADFAAVIDESPREGATNRIYVRLRNRGPFPAENVRVTLLWAFAGAGLPALPSDFWAAFDAGAPPSGPNWHLLGTKSISTLRYSGSSVAGRSDDYAEIVAFDFPAPAIDPTQPHPEHYCVVAIADCAQDPIDPDSKASLVIDSITPRDNNITQRNLVLQSGSMLINFSNPELEPTMMRYYFQPSGGHGIQVVDWLPQQEEGFQAGETRTKQVLMSPAGLPGPVQIIQQWRNPQGEVTKGGITIRP